jgi:N-acetylglucosaminyldiphosphoundecaprenol N-acetyl-beta-D-mannosaminyltransferase
MTYLADQSENSYGQPASVPDVIPRVNILGIGVSPVNLSQTVDILEKWRIEGRREYVLCTSVHGLMEAQRDPEVRTALNRSGLTVEDGMPLVWWCQRSGYFNAGRVNGPDLFFAMCERAAQTGHRHYFYGSSPRIIEAMVSRLAERYPGMTIAGYRSPPFRPLTPEEEASDIQAINDARPDYVWVGLGCPKQDRWVSQHVGKIQAAALLGVGAAFDIVAGVQPRAPRWMQRSGSEWLFRLVMEPRRLAHRYIVYNTMFVARALQQVTGWKSYARDW